MKKKIVTTALLVSCFMICLAAIADLNGKWAGKVNVDGTDYPLLYNLKADGAKLTGTALTPDGDVQITDGKINGSDFSFNAATGDLVIAHTGKLYADSVALDLDISGTKYHAVLKRPEEKK